MIADEARAAPAHDHDDVDMGVLLEAGMPVGLDLEIPQLGAEMIGIAHEYLPRHALEVRAALFLVRQQRNTFPAELVGFADDPAHALSSWCCCTASTSSRLRASIRSGSASTLAPTSSAVFDP